MPTPDYIAPETLEDALSIKNRSGVGARVIAGGTDLILRMRDRVFEPEVLVDLQRVSLDSIDCDEREMRIGPYVTHSQILADTAIATLFPALAESCRHFAGPPIRNRGTIGGNIVNASPAADLVPPLMAYDARIVLSSISGQRELALADFFTGPGVTVMKPDEILTEIILPLMPARTASCFIKLGHRRSMAISIVNLCARLSRHADGTLAAAKIVLGAVAPTPLHAVSAEEFLAGKKLSADQIAGAAKLASDDISPISDVRASGSYRRQMAEVLVRRALTSVWEELAEENADD